MNGDECSKLEGRGRALEPPFGPRDDVMVGVSFVFRMQTARRKTEF